MYRVSYIYPFCFPWKIILGFSANWAPFCIDHHHLNLLFRCLTWPTYRGSPLSTGTISGSQTSILITITLKVKVDMTARPLTENFSGTGLLQSQLWWASLLCHHHDGGDGYKYGDGGGYDGGGGNHGDHEDKEGEKDECHAAILVVVNVIFGPQFLPWQKFSGTKLDFHQTSTEAGLEKRAQQVFFWHFSYELASTFVWCSKCIFATTEKCQLTLEGKFDEENQYFRCGLLMTRATLMTSLMSRLDLVSWEEQRIVKRKEGSPYFSLHK